MTSHLREWKPEYMFDIDLGLSQTQAEGMFVFISLVPKQTGVNGTKHLTEFIRKIGNTIRSHGAGFPSTRGTPSPDIYYARASLISRDEMENIIKMKIPDEHWEKYVSILKKAREKNNGK